jgi:hypothetical protein
MAAVLSPPARQRNGHAAAGAHAALSGRRLRRLRPGSTSTRLRVLMIGLVAASVTWGLVAAWTASLHASAAGNVVHSSEPLSLDAQRIYQSLSGADITATTAFLSGPVEPLPVRRRYAADIASAAAQLAQLKSAAAAGTSRQVRASLAAISTGLPIYTADVADAQTYYSLGYQLTGASFIQVASEEMHLTLLPAARRIYLQENAALKTTSARATGLWQDLAALALAIAIAIGLYRTQRWLYRRTHRVVNYGLLMASAVLAISMLWLISASAVARADLQRGVGNGSTPAENLAQAGIVAQQARADEILNLISRSGSTSFEQNFTVLRSEIGPGPGTLLTDATASSGAGSASRLVGVAARDAHTWYASNEQVFRLDLAAHYAAETQLVVGTGNTSSAAGFDRLETTISRALAADQVTFRAGAAAGAGAFGGLQAGVAAAGLIMAIGCAWGLMKRLSEYR